MRSRLIFRAVILLIAVQYVVWRGPVSAAEAEFDPTAKRTSLSLHAGQHDRAEAIVSALIDAGKAQSVFVQYADGKLGRAQLVDPGMSNASWRGKGKKELHFFSPSMAKGETASVVALLSERPVEGRTYVWSGEPRQSRRLSCGECHQGLAAPTGEELRQEREVMELTGKPPRLDSPRILPTSHGEDFRWHEKVGRYQTSACWECHARHMVQYEFGQSLERDLRWAPNLPPTADAAAPPTVRSVYHSVFRVKDGQAVSHPLSSGDVCWDNSFTWRIHYGYQQATVGGEPCRDVLQRHVGPLSEEAGKFIGRHCVLIDWVAEIGQKRKAIAREERQLTVKDLRGRNRSYAMWIDFESTLTPTAGPMRLDDASPLAGFRFVPSIDAGTMPEYRESAGWKAITFVSEKSMYTVVCFNHPNNTKPLVDAASRDRDRNPTGPDAGIGYRFSAQFDGQNPLVVHYRLWIQGGRMPTEEIEAMANDFLDPITIEVR